MYKKGHVQSEATKEKIRLKALERYKDPDYKENHRKALIGRPNPLKGKANPKQSVIAKQLWADGVYTKERNDKVALSKMGDKNPAWIGGCNDYLHNMAWKMFGKDNCERCNMTNGDHIKNHGKRLSMHNKLTPKDYKSTNEDDWMVVCNICHQKVEHDS